MQLNNLEDAWALYRKLKANLDLQEEQLAASRAVLDKMKDNLDGLEQGQKEQGQKEQGGSDDAKS